MGIALRTDADDICCNIRCSEIAYMGKSASDPIAVLRGHRTDVHAVHFHPTLPLLYSGCARQCSYTCEPQLGLLPMSLSDGRRVCNQCATWCAGTRMVR